MRDFQKSFSKYFENEKDILELEKSLVAGGRLSLQEALGVYSNGYVARLTEALGEIFEGVWWVLGDSGFFEMCKRYIAATPSKSYNLSDYGDGFPAFLST